jgi:xylan 1,4-beta-xylosidase
MQEYSAAEARLVGSAHHIFAGTELGVTEGPHLYRKDGWYYLLTAEGGTSWHHAATLARSRSITGPYEVHPENPILTSRDRPDLPLQKAGHASLVEMADGEWYMAHLASRPVGGGEGEYGRCVLGRETALQRCEWGEDGWLRLAHGSRYPEVEVAAPDLPDDAVEAAPVRREFKGGGLPREFQAPRRPVCDSWCSHSARPGWLRLYGGESPGSRHEQSLVARRVEALPCRASTLIEFSPATFQQMAGLIAYYNTRKWYYVCVTHEEERGRVLTIMSCLDGAYREPLESPVPVPEGAIRLRATIDGEGGLRFSWAQRDEPWRQIRPVLDATILSDDYGEGFSFTGAFIGLCAQDLAGARLHADFRYFEYAESSA